ncbi:hypothetical protein Q3G72_006334 [Acer saccharum]|nr:hypothetical protein Q3G72_006334 [Acer saccharum]
MFLEGSRAVATCKVLSEEEKAAENVCIKVISTFPLLYTLGLLTSDSFGCFLLRAWDGLVEVTLGSLWSRVSMMSQLCQGELGMALLRSPWARYGLGFQ